MTGIEMKLRKCRIGNGGLLYRVGADVGVVVYIAYGQSPISDLLGVFRLRSD